jgi:hypothetical protein
MMRVPGMVMHAVQPEGQHGEPGTRSIEQGTGCAKPLQESGRSQALARGPFPKRITGRGCSLLHRGGEGLALLPD